MSSVHSEKIATSKSLEIFLKSPTIIPISTKVLSLAPKHIFDLCFPLAPIKIFFSSQKIYLPTLKNLGCSAAPGGYQQVRAAVRSAALQCCSLRRRGRAGRGVLQRCSSGDTAVSAHGTLTLASRCSTRRDILHLECESKNLIVSVFSNESQVLKHSASEVSILNNYLNIKWRIFFVAPIAHPWANCL